MKKAFAVSLLAIFALTGCSSTSTASQAPEPEVTQVEETETEVTTMDEVLPKVGRGSDYVGQDGTMTAQPGDVIVGDLVRTVIPIYFNEAKMNVFFTMIGYDSPDGVNNNVWFGTVIDTDRSGIASRITLSSLIQPIDANGNPLPVGEPTSACTGVMSFMSSDTALTQCIPSIGPGVGFMFSQPGTETESNPIKFIWEPPRDFPSLVDQ